MASPRTPPSPETGPASAERLEVDATSAAFDLTGQAKKAASDVADSAVSTAKDTIETATSAATEAATDRKEQATSALSDVATALHDTSDALREQDRDAFADYAAQAADAVERFTSGIRDRSVGEILDEAERFARREPGLFVGGAFLLGIVGARFLKASAPDGSGDGVPPPSTPPGGASRTPAAALPAAGSLAPRSER